MFNFLKILFEYIKLSIYFRINIFKLFLYFIELINDVRFWNYIYYRVYEAKKIYPDPRLGGWIVDLSCAMASPALFIYLLVRLTKPEVVVKTGVGPGASSALILNALNRNGKGVLYSIDLPGADAQIYPAIGKPYNVHVPPGFEVG